MNSDLEPSEMEGLADSAPKRSRLISKVLVPAIRLWLRSQVDSVEALQLEIEAGDRQILSGSIPQVNLAARQAVYRGLHLSRIDLVGRNICMNLGQVVRGKPFRLLEPIAIAGSVLLLETDLNASLDAPLLQAGVMQFLLTLLQSDATDQALNLQNLQIRLDDQQVTIAANLISTSGNETPIAIRSGFEMATPNRLKLVNPQWLPHANAKRGMSINDLNGYTFDLGDETEIQGLTIAAGQITCQAKLTVRP